MKNWIIAIGLVVGLVIFSCFAFVGFMWCWGNIGIEPLPLFLLGAVLLGALIKTTIDIKRELDEEAQE